jgi:hypothetical protein
MAFTSRPLSRNDRGQHSNYRRKFTISVHAVERYRERVDEEFRHRDDQDLGNMLDEKLQHPESKQTVRDTKAPEEVTQLFEIVMRTGSNYFVVMRNDTAVTVLDPSMVKTNFIEGTWKPALNTPFSGDALKKIQATGPRRLTSQAQAIARVDSAVPPKTAEIALPVHGAAPEYSPLELAGITHARALKRCREVDLALERAKREVERLEADKLTAKAEHEAAHAKLTELVENAP